MTAISLCIVDPIPANPETADKVEEESEQPEEEEVSEPAPSEQKLQLTDPSPTPAMPPAQESPPEVNSPLNTSSKTLRQRVWTASSEDGH